LVDRFADRRRGGGLAAFRPEQACRFGRIADVIAAQCPQHRIDALTHQVADGGAFYCGKIEAVGEGGESPSPVRIRGLAQVIGQQLELGVAAAGID